MTTSKKPTLSTDDLWLLRLFVLMRSAGERVSEDMLLAEFNRRKIGGVTALTLRTVLGALVKSGHLRRLKGHANIFEATSLGKKSASTTRVRLSNLLAITVDLFPVPGCAMVTKF